MTQNALAAAQDIETLAPKLDDLQNQAIDKAVELTAILQEISDILWSDGDEHYAIRSSFSMLATLREINEMIAKPANEIRATR